MRSPSGQTEHDPTTGEEIVYECHGNLYGKKDAGAVWMKCLADFFISHGYSQCPNEPCIFRRKKGTPIATPPPPPQLSASGGAAPDPTTSGDYSEDKPSGGAAPSDSTNIALGDTEVLCYVDDLLWNGDSDPATEQIKNEIISKFGEIDAHLPSMYLGANIIQDDRGVHICHRAMIERLGKLYFPDLDPSLYNLHGAQTPFPSNGSALGGEVNLADCPDTASGEPPLNAPYRELVGSLSYIALTSRPDIAWYTSNLARVQSSPGRPHFQLAKRVLKYLLVTKSHGIRYHRNGLGLHYYVDSSWADITPNYTPGVDGVPRTTADDDGRRSSYGYIGYYASGPISWASRIHKERRTLSTCEAELVAATEACKDLLHIRYVAKDMGISDIKGRTPMMEDNQSTIKLTFKTGISARTKHIEARWFFCRELQDSGWIAMTYKHTSEQVADLLTKRLNEATFKNLRDQLVMPATCEKGPQLDLAEGTSTQTPATT
jgi:hypothetical protein